MGQSRPDMPCALLGVSKQSLCRSATQVHTRTNVYMYIHIHIHKHTCLHTHTYVHACMHTYILTYLPTCKQTYRHDVHAHVRTYLDTYMCGWCSMCILQDRTKPAQPRRHQRHSLVSQGKAKSAPKLRKPVWIFRSSRTK